MTKTEGVYASETKLTPEQSRGEIERTLTRYGAQGFMYGYEGSLAVIQFKMRDRYLRLSVPLPTAEDVRLDPAGRRRPITQIKDALAKATRQRWRAVSLIVKAKCEAVSSGVVSFDDEWLSWMVLPDNSTVGEWAQPALEDAYRSGAMPKRMPGLPPPSDRD